MPTILLNKIRKGGTAPKNITVGSKEVKCVYKGSTLLYDTQKTTTTSTGTPSITYGTPVITISYGTIPRKGGTATPTITVTQKKTTTTPVTTTPVGHSGNSYPSQATTSNSSSTETITVTSYSKSFSGSAQNSSGATINTSTGVVSRTASLGTTYKASSWIVMNVTVSVTANGKSNTKTVSVYMESNTYTTSTSSKTNYSVRLSANPSDRTIVQGGETITFHPLAYSEVVTTTTNTYQTGQTTTSTSTSNYTTLATTTKVYVGGSLQTIKTIAANAAQVFEWTCPANGTSSTRTVSATTTITQSSTSATWENSQLGNGDVYVFQTGGLNMINYPGGMTSANGGAADVSIISTKNGSPQTYTFSSNVSWITLNHQTISAPSGFPYTGNFISSPKTSKNMTGADRTGTFTFTQSGSNLKLNYTITQSG